MSRIHGKNGEIKINGTVVIAQNKWNVDLQTDTSDATCFGDIHKVYAQSLPDLKGGFDGILESDGIGALLAATTAPDDAPNTLRITPNVLTFPAVFFEGPAWISTNTSGDQKDMVKTSCKFVAAAGAAWTVPGGSF